MFYVSFFCYRSFKGLYPDSATFDSGGARVLLLLMCVDTQAMSGVLNLIATIWESILPSLEESVNEPSLQLVQENVTGRGDVGYGLVWFVRYIVDDPVQSVAWGYRRSF